MSALSTELLPGLIIVYIPLALPELVCILNSLLHEVYERFFFFFFRIVP